MVWRLMVIALLPAFAAGAGVFGEAVRVPDVSDGAMSLAKEGTVLYCGADDALHVLDVSDALHPRLIRKITGFGFLRQLAVERGWVAVASRSGGAWLVDARDPAKAHVVSHFETVEQATGIDLAGDLMFVGQRGNGVEFVDISDRSHPEHVRMVKTSESQTVVYENGYVYSGDWHAGVTTIIDARDPATARVVASTALQGLGDGLDLDGRYLYAATGHHRLRGPHKDALHPENIGRGHGLEIWDRSDVLHPKFVSRVGFPRYWDVHNDLWTVRASGGWAFCADTYNGLFAVDARDPAQAKEVDRFCVKDPRNPQAPSCCISSVAIGDGAVYATALGQGLWTLPCAVAKSRDRVRGSLPANAAWRTDYPTVSDHFETWLPPRRGQVHSVAAYGDVHFVGCSYAGCFIVDENLKTVGTVPCAYARDVVVRDGRLYVAQGDDGLGIYSLENPRAPREVARLRNFVPGVTRCEWVYVPTARWAICGDRRRQKWHFMDLKALPKAKCAFTVHNLNWFRPMADGLLGGKWLGYAHTHSFVKWFDLSGDVPVMIDTANKAETGPLGQRTNFLRAKVGCNVFRDRLLISNDGGFVLLDPAQDRNADGSPWPTVKYANRPEVRVVGLPTWDGGNRVLLTCLNEMILSMVDFADPARPRLLWQEKTAGYPENALFHRGKFLVPCGYQGLLREIRRDGKAGGGRGPNDNAKAPPAAERLSTGAELFWYPAPETNNTGACVVVCPGGGYYETCISYEGWALAEWFNSIGVSAAVLDYHTVRGTRRHAAPLGDLPLQEVQEAIRCVRGRAAAFGIDPKKVGVMGFSAGGHLAATVMTRHDAATRPDFGILCYAVTDPLTHKTVTDACTRNLVGPDATAAQMEKYSPMRLVTKETPPVFILSTDSDGIVPSEQSVGFYLACRKAGVPAELHVWRQGEHGGGLCRDRPGEDRWPGLCAIWMRNMGFIGDKKSAIPDEP